MTTLQQYLAKFFGRNIAEYLAQEAGVEAVGGARKDPEVERACDVVAALPAERRQPHLRELEVLRRLHHLHTAAGAVSRMQCMRQAVQGCRLSTPWSASQHEYAALD